MCYFLLKYQSLSMQIWEEYRENYHLMMKALKM